MLWFFLHDQGEDVRKYDGEPPWRLKAHVHELHRKTTHTLDPDEGTSVLPLQKSSIKDSDQQQRGPAFGQVEERDSWVY